MGLAVSDSPSQGGPLKAEWSQGPCNLGARAGVSPIWPPVDRSRWFESRGSSDGETQLALRDRAKRIPLPEAACLAGLSPTGEYAWLLNDRYEPALARIEEGVASLVDVEFPQVERSSRDLKPFWVGDSLLWTPTPSEGRTRFWEVDAVARTARPTSREVPRRFGDSLQVSGDGRVATRLTVFDVDGTVEELAAPEMDGCTPADYSARTGFFGLDCEGEYRVVQPDGSVIARVPNRIATAGGRGRPARVMFSAAGDAVCAEKAAQPDVPVCETLNHSVPEDQWPLRAADWTHESPFVE